jgi:aminoglycoside phosphotransferase (APT) family kinase protein
MLVDRLADLHAVDIASSGLASLGKPTGFMTRQVRGWTERWHRSQTTTISTLDEIARWLREHLPVEPAAASIVHGDFKLDNVVFAESLEGIVAVLDWEMCALGDPLADLGILLAYWGPTAPPGDAPRPMTERPGWLTAEGLVERYALRSGRDVSARVFYEVFALFKVAVVIQQIFHRYVRGATTDERFAKFDARVALLASRATTRIERG